MSGFSAQLPTGQTGKVREKLMIYLKLTVDNSKSLQ